MFESGRVSIWLQNLFTPPAYTKIPLKAVKRGNYNVEQVDKLQDTIYWYQSGRFKKIKHEIYNWQHELIDFEKR